MLRLLDPPPESPRWGPVESLVLALWCAIAAFAVSQHIPWADESQAWLLADGVSWSTLFGHSLHYEGSGGLWHAVLKLLQAAHLRFTAARFLAAGVQGAAMAILLRYAPFPPLVRTLLPFTFFLLYQDAVIARSYCLFAILAFAAAALIRTGQGSTGQGSTGQVRSGRARPWLLASLLGLMANLSLHTAVAAAGLLLACLRSRRCGLRGSPAALLLLVVLWAVAIASMAPAADVDFGTGNNIHRSLAKAEQAIGMRVTLPAALPRLPMAGLEPVPTPVHVRHGFARAWNKICRALAVVTFPISSSRLLALALAMGVVAQARLGRRGPAISGPLGVVGLLPYELMVLAFLSFYLAPRHAGVILTGFVVAAWLTWPAQQELAGRRLLFERVLAGLLGIVCLQQIGWSLHAIRAEHRRPYAPGGMTAGYLHARGADAPGVEVAGYYYGSIDPLLYFPRNLYGNQPPHRYWLWSTGTRSWSTVQEELARRPAFVVVGGYENGPEAEITRDWQPVTPPVPGTTLNDLFQVRQYFAAHGYRATHIFCGHSWMRAGYAELLCDTVMEPAPRP